MASGHVNRTNRPNTWLHRPATRREDSPCQLGAVHTWHIAAPDVCDGTSAVGESRHRIPGASVGQPTEPCLALPQAAEGALPRPQAVTASPRPERVPLRKPVDDHVGLHLAAVVNRHARERRCTARVSGVHWRRLPDWPLLPREFITLPRWRWPLQRLL